ncbi:MAG TPA: porin family protein [Dysgonamonadaceae bacterium]|nr:porin family protein [Dysgonamonadaceae bacterium]
MKKIYLACLSLLMTAGLVKVNAQSPISYGVKAELNMSNFFLSDLDNYSSRMKAGPNLGGFMKIDLHENFAIQPELSFFYRTSKIKKEGAKNDNFEQWGMQIPIYAIGQTNLGNGRFYGGVGPFVGLGFDAKRKIKNADNIDLYKKVDGDKEMNRWDFGFGALLGYELNNKFQINAAYQVGVINQLDRLKDDAKLRSQVVSLGLGYRF